MVIIKRWLADRFPSLAEWWATRKSAREIDVFLRSQGFRRVFTKNGVEYEK